MSTNTQALDQHLVYSVRQATKNAVWELAQRFLAKFKTNRYSVLLHFVSTLYTAFPKKWSPTWSPLSPGGKGKATGLPSLYAQSIFLPALILFLFFPRSFDFFLDAFDRFEIFDSLDAKLCPTIISTALALQKGVWRCPRTSRRILIYDNQCPGVR